jgi:hypothetical protein
MTAPAQAPDLTQRAPRSPRLKLGGSVLLPRILDKERALQAATREGIQSYFVLLQLDDYTSFGGKA